MSKNSFEILVLAASTFVNIVLAFVTIYQVRTDKKLRIEERYTRMQYEAYARYLQDFTQAEEHDMTNLYSATFHAMLVSTPQNAKKFLEFTNRYRCFFDNQNGEDTLKELSKDLLKFQEVLHKELFSTRENLLSRFSNRLSFLFKRKDVKK